MHIYQSLNFAVRLSIVAIALCVQPPAVSAVDNGDKLATKPSSHVSVAPPTPRPADKVPQKGAWPFGPWSYAKAYTFNFFSIMEMESGTPLMVVGSNGRFSPYIRSEHLISDDDARSAAMLVAETKGSFETSKCNFPRHAVVLFDKNDKPVAAANVCFECGGTIIWPHYKKDEQEELSDDEWDARFKQYEAALAKWETLFGAKIGLPVNYKDVRD